ncbi:MAG: hypothetical protein K0S45_430 [Nitrospira sp.]|jgi:hypothetical protein|nr:hypothetical protein [Nitrospira sp.]
MLTSHAECVILRWTFPLNDREQPQWPTQPALNYHLEEAMPQCTSEGKTHLH